MNRVVPIRVASGLVLVAAAFAAFGCALLPFVALFMADGPAGESPIFGLFKLGFAFALISMPFLAVASGVFALKAMWNGYPKTLLVAVLLGCLPAVAALVVHHPTIFATKPKCVPQPTNGPPVVVDVRCSQRAKLLSKR